jgi:hypothetical protein
MGQQLGQFPGVLVAGLGSAAVGGEGVAVQQPVPGAVGEAGGGGRVVEVADGGISGGRRHPHAARDHSALQPWPRHMVISGRSPGPDNLGAEEMTDR